MSELDRASELAVAGAQSAQVVRRLFFASRVDHRGLRRFMGPKRAFALAALTVLILGAWYLRRHGILDPRLVEAFARDYPIAAPTATILVYALAVLTGLPTLPLNLAAGVFWGPWLGGLISAAATTLGAVAAFAAARSIFGRPLANRFDNKLVARLQGEFEVEGWRFIAFLRLNPVFPTGPLNYMLGLTGIDAVTYTWATFVFLLAPSVAVAFMGHSVGTFVVEGDIAGSIRTMLALSGGVTVLAALAYGARLFAQWRGGRDR